MRKLWSAFWLVVASFVAATIIWSVIHPFLWVIVLVVCVVVMGAIGYRVWRLFRSGRRHFR